MIMIGVVLLIVAIVCVVFGLAVHAVHILLWIGIVLVVVGVILALVGRNNRTGTGGPVV